MNWLIASGGQSIGASASALLMSIQGGFPFGFLAVQGTSYCLFKQNEYLNN